MLMPKGILFERIDLENFLNIHIKDSKIVINWSDRRLKKYKNGIEHRMREQSIVIEPSSYTRMLKNYKESHNHMMSYLIEYLLFLDKLLEVKNVRNII